MLTNETTRPSPSGSTAAAMAATPHDFLAGINESQFLAGVAHGVRMLKEGLRLGKNSEASLMAEFRGGEQQINFVMDYWTYACADPDFMNGFTSILSSYVSAEDAHDPEIYSALTYAQISGAGLDKRGAPPEESASPPATPSTMLSSAPVATDDSTAEYNFMEGWEVAVEMLAAAASMEESPDLLELDGTFRPGRKQVNIAHDFVNTVIKNPWMAEGFAAVLTAIIGPNILDRGICVELATLPYEQMMVPAERRDPETMELRSEVARALLAKQAKDTKPRRASTRKTVAAEAIPA